MLRKIVHSPGKELFLCLLSAVLLILSFPPSNIWLFAGLGFLPLFFTLQDKSKGKAFLLSYLTGVIFWSGIIYWLIHVSLPGMILLILYLALYFGLFGLIISRYPLSGLRQASLELLFFLPSLWVVLEYLRVYLLTGFGWALLGYSQYLNLPLIQIADITGVWGVSFLVMMANIVIYSVLSRKLSVLKQRQKLILPILCILIALSYGYYKLYYLVPTTYHLPLRISVIQGNIPQELKWEVVSREFIIDRYLALTRKTIKDEPALIIWPEASLPVVLEEEPRYYERVTNFVQEINTPLLLGAVTVQNNFYYNSALLLSGEGKLLSRYDKLHLVPFGEYIPLRKILGFLETIVPIGDFTRGREHTVFSLPATHSFSPIPLSVLICFEDLFPQLSREFVKRGARLLVNITNDAWFGQSSCAQQHFQASVFRAVENRVSLVRSANTGVSGFISPKGEIISLVQDKEARVIFINGYRTKEVVIPERSLSFYTRYGDIFVLGCFLMVLYGIISSPRKNEDQNV